MIALQVFWSYVKKYWFLALAVAGVVVGYILFKKSDVDLGKLIEGINDDHKKDLESIKNKEQSIADAKKQIAADEQKQLDAANKKFDAAKKALEAEQQAKADEIMKNTNGDPEELARQLALLTGSTKLDN